MPNHKLRFQCSKCLRSTAKGGDVEGFFVCEDCGYERPDNELRIVVVDRY